MNPAPIVLFTYSRLKHTMLTIEALLRNKGAENHDLIVYSDGHKSSDDIDAVFLVREYLHTISGFRSINIRCRESNFGLAKSIIDGVTEVLHSAESIIVLEDDMVTSPYFLNYMQFALDKFSLDNRVISISGYVYPVNQLLPEAFFLRGADCWGWGTWRRGWELFNHDGQMLLNELMSRKLIDSFDFNNTFGFSKMLKAQINGENNSWAIRWYASAFLANKLTLYPGRSLVQNIGNDLSGTHCSSNSTYDIALSDSPINLICIDVEPSSIGKYAFEKFFAHTKNNLLSRIISRLNKILLNFLKLFNIPHQK